MQMFYSIVSEDPDGAGNGIHFNDGCALMAYLNHKMKQTDGAEYLQGMLVVENQMFDSCDGELLDKMEDIALCVDGENAYNFYEKHTELKILNSLGVNL